MGLLPAYIDKIEELALSEQDTPGQIHAFLSFFPSFTPFKRLRTLYFHYNGKAVDWHRVARALLSLFTTTISTLSIKITKAENDFSVSKVIVDLLQLKTLRRFCLVSDLNYIDWNYLPNISSNIEYLTIPGRHCEFRHLRSICQWAPRLKYLDIGIISGPYTIYNKLEQSSEKNIIPMSTLRTLVLSVEDRHPATVDMLAPYLNAMPVLNHLEIKAKGELVDAAAWKKLLETSLPLLTHFTLRTTAYHLQNVNIYNVLKSFRSSFWLSKKNFNIIITDHKGLKLNRFVTSVIQSLDAFNLPVFQCWVEPDHTVNDGFITVNKITSLRLSVRENIVLCHYYFGNVTCLTVDNMDRSLFKWMTTYVNCSQIKELIITLSYKETDELTSLLACVPNMSSLHISFDLLITNKDAFVGKNNSLKRLDISIPEHMFKEEDIIVIAKLFPYVEHIQINTSNLYNVPLLKTYLPHLRSLTFDTSNNRPSYFDDDVYTEILRQETKFFFQNQGPMITVWIDQAVYEEPYWQRFAVKSSQSIATSITTNASNNEKKKKKKGIFSFLKFFK